MRSDLNPEWPDGLTRLVEALDLDDGLEWMRSAACRGMDPNIFTPPSGQTRRGLYDEARAVCGNCHVRGECLEHALDANELHGVWGGLSPSERRRVRRARRSAA